MDSNEQTATIPSMMNIICKWHDLKRALDIIKPLNSKGQKGELRLYAIKVSPNTNNLSTNNDDTKNDYSSNDNKLNGKLILMIMGRADPFQTQGARLVYQLDAQVLETGKGLRVPLELFSKFVMSNKPKRAKNTKNPEQSSLVSSPNSIELRELGIPWPTGSLLGRGHYFETTTWGGIQNKAAIYDVDKDKVEDEDEDEKKWLDLITILNSPPPPPASSSHYKPNKATVSTLSIGSSSQLALAQRELNWRRVAIVEATTLKTAIKQVAFSASANENCPILASILVSFKANHPQPQPTPTTTTLAPQRRPSKTKCKTKSKATTSVISCPSLINGATMVMASLDTHRLSELTITTTTTGVPTSSNIITLLEDTTTHVAHTKTGTTMRDPEAGASLQEMPMILLARSMTKLVQILDLALNDKNISSDRGGRGGSTAIVDQTKPSEKQAQVEVIISPSLIEQPRKEELLEQEPPPPSHQEQEQPYQHQVIFKTPGFVFAVCPTAGDFPKYYPIIPVSTTNTNNTRPSSKASSAAYMRALDPLELVIPTAVLKQGISEVMSTTGATQLLIIIKKDKGKGNGINCDASPFTLTLDNYTSQTLTKVTADCEGDITKSKDVCGEGSSSSGDGDKDSTTINPKPIHRPLPTIRSVGVNVAYLMQVLNIIDTSHLTLEIRSPHQPFVIRSVKEAEHFQEKYVHVLMPLRWPE